MAPGFATLRRLRGAKPSQRLANHRAGRNSHAMILAIALALDAVFGEPRLIWDRLAHPAVLMGRLVGDADQRFNRGAQAYSVHQRTNCRLQLGGDGVDD